MQTQRIMTVTERLSVRSASATRRSVRLVPLRLMIEGGLSRGWVRFDVFGEKKARGERESKLPRNGNEPAAPGTRSPSSLFLAVPTPALVFRFLTADDRRASPQDAAAVARPS
jgi:hypothetical protein